MDNDVYEYLKGGSRLWGKIRINLNKAISEDVNWSLTHDIYNRFLDSADCGFIQYFIKCRLHQYEESKPV